MTDTATGPAIDDARLDPALVKLGLILVIGALVSVLDTTIVSVAIDDLGRTFHSPLTTVQWVSTAYLLALALVIPLTGWAMERFGAKTMWMFSLTVFLIFSVLCGMAWSIGSLIAFRALTGLGGGMILPIAQTILAQTAGPDRLGRVMSIVGIPAQVAPIFGPVIGGMIVDASSWRWVFYINVPVCAVALVLAWRGIPRDTARPAQRLDFLGLALLSPAVAAIVFGLSQVDAHGPRTGAMLTAVAIGLVLLGAFVVHALRTRVTPLIDVRLFTDRAFAVANVLMFLFGMSVFGAMFLLPLYYQQVRGASAFSAGLMLAPQFAGMIIGVLLSGRAVDRLGSRPVVLAGMAIGVLGTIPYTQVGPHTDHILLGAALIVRGAGLGAASVAVMTAAYQGLQRDAMPRATSALNVVQRVGSPFGAALVAMMLQRGINGSKISPATLATAYGHAFWWPMGLAALAVVPALLLPSRRRARSASSRRA
jgi:EmrB/QacA subfamily drug resistance transporter